jgi:MFS family permease
MSPRLKRAGDRTFSSLRIRNYRLYFIGQLISVSGTWIQWVAQAWLIIHTLNAGGVVLGIATALQFVPSFFGGLWGGLIADRFDKRVVLIWTQALQAVLALALGLLAVTHVVQIWHVYVLAFLFGAVTVVDMPARQSFVIEMVGSEEVPNAVALNSAVFNGGRLIGPAIAALLIKFSGIPSAFFVNAVSFAAVIVALWVMDPAALHRGEPVKRAPGQLREGLRFVRDTRILKDTLILVAVVATFGFNFMIVLPLMAKVTFHGGPGIYGLLSSIMAIGSIAGGLYTAAKRKPTMRLLISMAFVFGVTTIAASAAPNVALASLLLIPVGLTSMIFISNANSTLQLNSPAVLRGRVMAVYSLLFLGGTAIGGPIAGWVTQYFGPREGLGFGAVLSVIAAVVLWIRRGYALKEAPVQVGASVVPMTETSAVGDIAGDTPAPAAR